MPEDKDVVVVPDRKLEPVEETALEAAFTNYLTLNSEQRAILEEPIPSEDLDILPTGEVYASQVQYRRRLNRVFGAGAWVMREQSSPTIKSNIVMQKWSLYAHGVFISTAWGEQEYYENNPRMSYATALEAAKSNALMRNCKDLGIASECWDRHFTDRFKIEYCTQVITQQYGGGGGRREWRRKDGTPLRGEQQPEERIERAGGAGPARETTANSPRATRAPKQAPAPPPPPAKKISPEQAHELRSLAQEAQVEPKQICGQFSVQSEKLEDLPESAYEEVKGILTNRRELVKRGQFKLD